MNSTREVLLVEDNPADAYLICEILDRESHSSHVTVTSDGCRAMSYLREHGADSQSPDLLILDLNLPVKDGRAVLSEVKSDPSLRKLPVVVFTTSKADSDIDRSYELGANSYVSKPGSLNEFVEAMEAISRFWLGPAVLPGRNERVATQPPGFATSHVLSTVSRETTDT